MPDRNTSSKQRRQKSSASKPPAGRQAASTRGGKRPGAGRPSSQDGRSERLSVRLTPKLAERLRESGRAGELIEAALEFGDSNQTGLPLSFLAEFARLGRRYWPDEGDGIVINDIPLDLPNAVLREQWVGGHDDAMAIEAAYRQFSPLAHRVRDTLLSVNPLLTAVDLDPWHSWRHTQPGACVDVRKTFELLHAYALIVNDGVLPCGGRALARFIWERESEWDNPARWISEALERGRPDVAVAFGAGDYAVTGEAAVVERVRADLRDVDTALAWWARCPDFCRRVDPDIERVAGISGFRLLAKLAEPLKYGASLMTSIPVDFRKYPALSAFRAAWWRFAAQHGEDILLYLLERFNVITGDMVRRLLAVQIPGESPVSDYAILGLMPGAARRDIEAAFRRLAQKHHPDKGGQAADFDRIRQARDRLVSR
jgi:hypothetical protein